MSLLATDDFNRANSASLGANWTTQNSENAPEINSNEARAPTGGGISGSRYTAVSAPNDQYSEVLIGSVVSTTSDEGVGPSCRMAAAAFTHYFAQATSTETRMWKVVAGAFTQLGSDGAGVVTGDLIRLICNGTSISVTKNGSTIIGPVTDSAIASGNFGIWASDIGAGKINTWNGGDLASASVGATKSSGPGISPDYTQLFRSRPLGFSAAATNVTVALTGQTATFTPGTLAHSTTVALVGSTATFAPGTLKANTDKGVTGQTGTFTAGTLAPSTSVPLVGATATFAAGTFSASTGGDITVALTGQTATFTPGTLSPAIDKGLTGSTATFAAGTLAPSTAVALSGATATFTPGTFGPQVTGDVTVSLTGITATFTPGIMAPSGGDSGSIGGGGSGAFSPSGYFPMATGIGFNKPKFKKISQEVDEIEEIEQLSPKIETKRPILALKKPRVNMEELIALEARITALAESAQSAQDQLISKQLEEEALMLLLLM